MKAIKALVIGMGLLIVVGLGLLGFGLYRNAHHLAANSAPRTAELPSTVAPPGAIPRSPTAGPNARGYFTTELPVPGDSRLEQMATAGDRVILRFTGAQGDRLLVLDPHNGQITGTIALVPQTR